MKFEMYIQENDINSTTNEIPFQIRNIGEKSVSFIGYSIETFKEDSWYVVPFNDNLAFSSKPTILNPGETFQDNLLLYILQYKLTKGRYRIVKEFTSNKSKVTLTVEFTMH